MFMKKSQYGFTMVKRLVIFLSLAIVVVALIPVNRTCSKKGYVCAQPPRHEGQVACYHVSKKPLILDVLNIDLSYSSFERCV